MLFHPRVDLGEGADRTRDRAGRDFLAREHEALAGAGKFRVRKSKLQPEGDGFGMNAVGTADGRCHLVLEGAILERGEQLVDISDQQVRGAGELHIEARVEHVGGGHALVHETRLGADDFG